MEVYAQYLQKMSDLITREGIFIPPALNHDLLEIHQRSLLLERVLNFSSQANIEFNNKLFEEFSTEDILYSKLFLEFQNIVKEKEFLRAEEIQYQEELKEESESIIESLSEDNDDTSFNISDLEDFEQYTQGDDGLNMEMGDDEEWTEAEDYVSQISSSDSIKQEVAEYEEVSFEVSFDGAEFSGRDDYGLDIYGNHLIKPFQEEIPQTDAVVIKPIVFENKVERIPYTGKDKHCLDIYGQVSIQLFETNPKLEHQKEIEEPLGEISDLSNVDKVVTITNTPVTSEELDKLAVEAEEVSKPINSDIEEELFNKEFFPNNHYPKDIQESDKIIDLVANVEKKIGGFLRGFRKKD